MLAGAIISLVVAVFSGIIVYLVTREKKPLLPFERLVYTLERPFSFETEATRNAFQVLRVANLGELNSESVSVALELPKGFKIVDKKVSLSSGPAGAFTTSLTGERVLQINMPSLAPGEILTVSLMVDGIPDEKTVVGVKSAKTVGKEGLLIKEVPDKNIEKQSVALLIILSAISFQVVLVFVAKPQIARFVKQRYGRTRSVNNTAFLYLHTGLLKEAQDLLRQAIKTDGADCLMLANYALAIGFRNADKLQQSNKLLDAAEFYSFSIGHEFAVVLFNRSLLMLKHGDRSNGLEKMSESLNLSKKEILR